MRKRGNNLISENKGFTLVELVVVMVLLGIMAAISIMGINAWQDWAFFNSANTGAEVIFVQSQDQLSALKLGGDTSDLIQRLEHANGNGAGKIDESMLGTLTAEDGSTYTMDSVFPESVGKSEPDKYREDIWYVMAEKGDYSRFTEDPTSVSEGARILFEFLTPVLKDAETLNGAICVEFTALDGQVFGVFYSDRLGGFSYADASSNVYDSVSIRDRQRPYRRENIIGYYGADTLAKAQKGRDVDLEWIEIHNEETLNVRFDGKGYNTRKYVLTINDNSTMSKLLEIHIDGSKINSLANKDTAIACETKRYNAAGNAVSMGNVDFLCWFDDSDGTDTVYLVLDGADVSATTDEYLKLLTAFGEDDAAFADDAAYASSGARSQNFIVTRSIARFDIPLNARLDADVRSEGSPESAKISTLDIDPSDDAKKDFRVSSAGFDNTTEFPDPTVDPITYNISNCRHLYNVRYIEMYNSCLKEVGGKNVLDADTYANFKGRPDGKTNDFVVLNDLDWYDFTNSKEALFDSKNILAAASALTIGGVSVDRHSCPFPSIEKLYAGDTFKGAANDTNSGETNQHNNIKLLNFSFKQNLDEFVLRNGDHTGLYLPKYTLEEIGTIDAATGSQTEYHLRKNPVVYESVYPIGLFSENYGSIEKLIMDGVVVENDEFMYEGENKGGKITGAFCGVNYGKLDNLKIYNGYSDEAFRSSTIIGDSYVGGFFGATPIVFREEGGSYVSCADRLDKVTEVKMQNLENHAFVKANHYGGGIAGYIKNEKSSSSKIHTLTIENCLSIRVAHAIGRKSVETDYVAEYFGGIVGYMENVTDNVEDLKVNNCRVCPLITDEEDAAYKEEHDKLLDAESRTALVGDYVGGIVGGNEAGLLTNCQVCGDIAKVLPANENVGTIRNLQRSSKDVGNTVILGGDFVGGLCGSLEYRKKTDASGYIVPDATNYKLMAGVIGNKSGDTKSKSIIKNSPRVVGMNYVGGIVGLADTGSDIDYCELNFTNDTWNTKVFAAEYSSGGLAGTCFSVQALNCLDNNHHIVNHGQSGAINTAIRPGRVISRAIAGGYFGTVFIGDEDPSVNPADANVFRAKNTGNIYVDYDDPAYKENPYKNPIADDMIESGYDKDAYMVKIGDVKNNVIQVFTSASSGGYAGYIELFDQSKGKYSAQYAKSFRDSMYEVHKLDTSNTEKYRRTTPVFYAGSGNAYNGNVSYFNLTCDYLLTRRINDLKGTTVSNANKESASRGLLFDGVEAYKDSGRKMVKTEFTKRLQTTFLSGGMLGMTERNSSVYVEDLSVGQNNNVLGCKSTDSNPRLETHGTKAQVDNREEPTGIPDKYNCSRNDVHMSYEASVIGRVNERMIVRHCEGWCKNAVFSGWDHGGICSVNAGRLENCVATSYTSKNLTTGKLEPYNASFLWHMGGLSYLNGGEDPDHPAVQINCSFENDFVLHGKRDLGGFTAENGAFGIIILNRENYEGNLIMVGQTDDSAVGMIAGQNSGRIIIDIPKVENTNLTENACAVKGSVKLNSGIKQVNASAGGFVGKNKCCDYGKTGEFHTGTIENKTNVPIINYADVSLSASIHPDSTVGGIVGEATGEFALKNAVNFGKLTSTGNVGGIVGYRRGYSSRYYYANILFHENYGQSTRTELVNCTNLGDLDGSFNAGGIVGILQYFRPEDPDKSTDITTNVGGIDVGMENCTDLILYKVRNEGNITGRKYAGGIVAYVSDSYSEDSMCNVKIEDAINTGDVKATYDSADTAHAGGIIGLIGGAAGGESAIRPACMMTRLYYCRNFGNVVAVNTNTPDNADAVDMVRDATEIKYCLAVDNNLTGKVDKAAERELAEGENYDYEFKDAHHFGGVRNKGVDENGVLNISVSRFFGTADEKTATYSDGDIMRYNFFVGKPCLEDDKVIGEIIDIDDPGDPGDPGFDDPDDPGSPDGDGASPDAAPAENAVPDAASDANDPAPAADPAAQADPADPAGDPASDPALDGDVFEAEGEEVSFTAGVAEETASSVSDNDTSAVTAPAAEPEGKNEDKKNEAAVDADKAADNKASDKSESKSADKAADKTADKTAAKTSDAKAADNKTAKADDNEVEIYDDLDMLLEEVTFGEPTMDHLWDQKISHDEGDADKTKNDLYEFYVVRYGADPDVQSDTDKYYLSLFGYRTIIEILNGDTEDETIKQQSADIDDKFCNYDSLGADDDGENVFMLHFLNHLFKVGGLTR